MRRYWSPAFEPKTERDPEIQDLLQRSAGLNLALDYLPGSITFDPMVDARLGPIEKLASAIVWFDAYITNVDRTPRNTNLLWWHRKLWLIDHGAALYVQHTWTDYLKRARSPFAAIKDHVLLPVAGDLRGADETLAPRITPALIEAIVALVPDAWLSDEPAFVDHAAQRRAYVDYLVNRLESPRMFVEEAINVRAQSF